MLKVTLRFAIIGLPLGLSRFGLCFGFLTFFCCFNCRNRHHEGLRSFTVARMCRRGLRSHSSSRRHRQAARPVAFFRARIVQNMIYFSFFRFISPVTACEIQMQKGFVLFFPLHEVAFADGTYNLEITYLAKEVGCVSVFPRQLALAVSFFSSFLACNVLTSSCSSNKATSPSPTPTARCLSERSPAGR